MFFKNKKKKKSIDEETLEVMNVGFEEFKDFEEEDSKKRNLSVDAYEKNFIVEIEKGCPICRGDVKGNDHYKYYCKNCNILFDKEQIMEKDFGKHADQKINLKVRKLSDRQKRQLADKKKRTLERMKKAFSEKEEKKKEVTGREKAEETENDEEMLPPFPGMPKVEDVEETEDIEVIPPHPEQEEKEKSEESEEPEEGEETEEKEESEEDFQPGTYEETEPLETEEEPEEYNLEEEGKIIASSGSSKIHKGDCHFVKKIHPENRIYFDSIEEGLDAGYEMCVCLRRLVAKRKLEKG